MCRPTLNQVSYLLNPLQYLYQYIGELHRKSHQPPTMYSFTMLYSMQCSIRFIRPSFCSPSAPVSGRCPQSTCGDIWLDFQDHTIRDCFCPFDFDSSETCTMPYRDAPVWWDSPYNIPEWLGEKSLIVWPNVGVCGQEYCQEDWQITET